ncbi:MAG: HD-GYP domain-containing protein [Bacillota bacterium]
MRKVLVDNAEPGSKLAKAVFTAEGRVLLTSGMILRDSYVEKLKANGISEIFIEDDISEGIEVSDVICDKTRVEAKTLVKNLMGRYSFTSNVNAERVKDMVNKIIDELLNNREVIVNLADIKSVDDYTFEHSVNVCILSLITGIGLGYNVLRLKDLGVGALLHDIGKLRIPEEILKKPSQLSVEEFEEIKKHTIYGYEILKKCKNISMISAFIAFGHHERYDGSGYPLQLRGENIHQCARIVAVADVYDALTSDRVYRKKLKPNEVVRYITSLGSHHFDKEIVKSFISYIAVYPVGTGVVLNTKERGLIVRTNRIVPTKPVVRVIYNENNEKLKNFYEVDLAKKGDTYILDFCDL